MKLSALPITAASDTIIDISGKVSEITSALVSDSSITSIALFGDWGTGKTTILQLCSNELRGDDSVTTIWVDSWRYSGLSTSFWKVIAASMVGALTEDLDDASLEEEVTPGTTLQTLLREVNECLYRSYSFTETSKSIDYKSLGWKSALISARLLSNFIPGGSIAKDGIDLFTKNISELEDVDSQVSFFEKEEIEQYRAELTSVEQFCALFDQLNTYLQKTNRFITIFLDDLDRCSAAEMYEFIISLRALLSRERIKIVFACDQAVLNAAIDQYWSHAMGGDASVDRKGVTEKVFDYSTRLKPLSEADFQSICNPVLLDSLNESQVQLVAACLPRNLRKLIKVLIKVQLLATQHNAEIFLQKVKLLVVEETDMALLKEIYTNEVFINDFATQLNGYREGLVAAPKVETALDRLLLSTEFPSITSGAL